MSTFRPFKKGAYTFQVVEMVGSDLPYAGYCDGELSVQGSHPDLVIRALTRKHILGLPEGKVIPFPIRSPV